MVSLSIRTMCKKIIERGFDSVKSVFWESLYEYFIPIFPEIFLNQAR